MDNLRKRFCSILILVVGWLAGRLGLAVVPAASLLRRPDGEDTIKPGTKLIPRSFIGIDPLVVEACGAEAAVLLETVTFWLDFNGLRGRDDTYNSQQAWADELFRRTGIRWDRSKVGRLIGKLKAADFLAADVRKTTSQPTTYRAGAALEARWSDLHQVDALVQQALPFVEQAGAKVHQYTSVTPQINSSKQETPTPAAGNRAGEHAETRARSAAAPVSNHLSEILDSRETPDQSMDTQPEGGEIRHARRPAPPPVPRTPSPRQPHPLAPSPSHQNAGEGEITTEMDITEEAEPISAAISGVFAPVIARRLIDQYGAATVEAMIADTSDPKKYPDVRNLGGFVRSRLAAGDPVQTPQDKFAHYANLMTADEWLAARCELDTQMTEPLKSDPARDAWRVAHSQLEIQLDRGNFQTWVRDAEFVRAEGDLWTIRAAHSMACDQLRHRLYKDIRRVLSDVVGRKVEIEFVVEARA